MKVPIDVAPRRGPNRRWVTVARTTFRRQAAEAGERSDEVGAVGLTQALVERVKGERAAAEGVATHTWGYIGPRCVAQDPLG